MTEDTQYTEKYRPRVLSDLYGQRVAADVIDGMLKSGDIKPTIMLTGSYGTGKTTSARMIAGYLNCDNGPSVFCGTCRSCQQALKGNHPDIHEINCGADRGIDAIRNLISMADMSPRHRYRVFILDEFHAITGSSASAMLKPLESPPRKTVWIICTTEPQSVLKTIKSRSLEIKLSLVEPNDMLPLLRKVSSTEGLPFNDDILFRIAESAEGHPRDALNALQKFAFFYHNNKGDTSIDFSLAASEKFDEFVSIPHGRLATKYIEFILSGDFDKSLQVFRHTDNHPHLVEMILGKLKDTALAFRGSEFASKETVKFLNDSCGKFMNTVSYATVLDLYKLHIEYYDKLKSYSMKSSEVVDLMVMDSFASVLTPVKK